MIGKEIRRLRKQKKMSQEVFGALLGIAQNTVSDIENGKREPGKPVLMLIRAQFGLDFGQDAEISLAAAEEPAPCSLVGDHPAEFQPYINAVTEILRSDDEIIKNALMPGAFMRVGRGRD